MRELRLTSSQEPIDQAPGIGREASSDPERELNSFIDSMAMLIGPGASGSLTELWLDELACMDCFLRSEGFSWRSVSLSASVRLANRVIASQLSGRLL